MYIILSILNRFNLFNFNTSFLWPQRNEAERNSRRRFRSHENCIIQQSSLTTRDFVYFKCFKITQTVRHCVSLTFSVHSAIADFLVTWYLLYFIFRHSEFISESNMKEMLKQVQHDRWVKIVGCMECTNKKYSLYSTK